MESSFNGNLRLYHHLPLDTEKDHQFVRFEGFWACSCGAKIYQGSPEKHNAESRHAMHIATVRSYRVRDMEVAANGGYSDNAMDEPNQFSPFRRGVTSR